MAQRQFRSDDTSIWPYGFGDGSDGALTISANTTEAPIDASCSGTSGATSLSATNASFAAGQVILIHQTRGTGSGGWELNKIAAYSSGTITTALALTQTYTDSGDSQAQVRVLKQYSAVTIDSTKIYTAKAWDNNVGGIIGWLCSGTTTITGTLAMNGVAGSQYSGSTTGGGAQGIGFDGGDASRTASSNIHSYRGEGSDAATTQTYTAGSGGGGGSTDSSQRNSGSPGGAGYAAGGQNGQASSNNGTGGTAYGSASLVALHLGSGGGGGRAGAGQTVGGGGGGGGIALIISKTFTMSGAITSNGGNGANGTTANTGDGTVTAPGGGGGSGGSVLIKAQTATLGTNLITAAGGSGGTGLKGNGASLGNAGNGSVGRIHLDYKTSYTGTTTPTLDSTQDLALDYHNVGASFIYQLLN